MSQPPLPISFEGSAAAKALLRASGWTLQFQGLPAKQGVLIAYPHTSNWDFVIGMIAKSAAGLPIAFWGKDSLFRIPGFGRWLRGIGGIPVERSTASNQVQAMAERFRRAREHDELLWLALAPEGTRSWRPRWRSGFYHLALAADVPLGVARLDWGRRVVAIDTFLHLTGDLKHDRAAIARALHGTTGKRPKLAAPVEF